MFIEICWKRHLANASSNSLISARAWRWASSTACEQNILRIPPLRDFMKNYKYL